ncbi:sialate O-acetylesterase [Methyloceanibacter sp.]|uniref:sialate O-acetylesterase n=1 Tax=Methyloceanibacter sp. TaxID=1965321 RepID=UPI003D6CD601
MRRAALTLILMLLAQECSAQTDLYLIALMGQSNMEGRGELSELPPGFPANPTEIWNFTNAYQWEPAKEPIDSPEGQVDAISIGRRGGVGPSLALADAFVSAHPSTSVGLIPCARGATTISEWLKVQTDDPRSTLYGSCMNRMKTVSPANGTVRAVIFWQGGSDAKSQEDALSWKDRFTALVADLRADLGNPDLPIIMVMLGDPDIKVAKKYPYWQAVRAQQQAVNIPGVTKIEANGYERKADGIHFTTNGQLGLGAALARLLPAP